MDIEKNWLFLHELREARQVNLQRASALPGEIDLRGGVRLQCDFPDPEKLLDSAFNDLKQVFRQGNVPHDRGSYPIVFRQAETPCFEAFRIEVGREGCVVEAADTEGIRRAVYYLEDELTISGGPFLRPLKLEREPFVKSRISRCFFGPLKRPPYFRDELMDDVDYYPPEYLSRLAHEGVNGLWLTIDFKSLGNSGVLPVDEHAAQRLAKLRRTVDSCRRYGIGIYLFCTEPIAFDENDPILQKYPELAGSRIPGKYGFCPNSATAQRYLEETTYSIFSAAPNLAGMIVLSVGEWFTLCCNTGPEALAPCPRCSDLPHHKVLAMSLQALQQGMHRANPRAQLVSWPYTQVFSWGYDQSAEAASHMPLRAALMHNFESLGGKKQLGKMRTVSDYWLSYIGPSPFFRENARRAREAGTPMFAKLQVGCSHECATTQYIPVPANLYHKYRAMRRLGVSGVMQCWYFGAYPSLMTQAAGMLAFEPFPQSEDQFLTRLAAMHWGEEHTATAVKAWKLFSKAYNNYPLSNELGYIGPMHDSVVWHLHLKPVNRRLTPTWLSDFPAPGDRILECISSTLGVGDSFSLDEIIKLTSRMARIWAEGVRAMHPLYGAADTRERRRELGVAEAVGLLFAAAAGIFKFYRLREKMIFATGTPRLKMLRQMEKLVREQIDYSTGMLKLCADDPTLGFHSEAEGYKFNAESLRERIGSLHSLLENDFKDVERQIRRGEPLFPEYTGATPDGLTLKNNSSADIANLGYYALTYKEAYPNLDFVRLDNQRAPGTSFRATYGAHALTLFLDAETPMPRDRFIIYLETRKLAWPEIITVYADGKTLCKHDKHGIRAIVTKSESGWHAELKIPLSILGSEQGPPKPLRINIERTYEKDGRENTIAWIQPKPLRYIFVLGAHNPDDYGWLLP